MEEVKNNGKKKLKKLLKKGAATIGCWISFDMDRNKRNQLKRRLDLVSMMVDQTMADMTMVQTRFGAKDL